MITIYSIGYQGLSPADLWALLLGHGCRVVVDVRPHCRMTGIWGRSTIKRGARHRDVQYLRLEQVADVDVLAASHRTALLSRERYHQGTIRDSVARASGLLALPLCPTPRQIELWEEAA